MRRAIQGCLVAGVLALASVGCGDDDGGGGTPDGGGADGGGADGDVTEILRSGTIAVAQTQITGANGDLPAGGLSGATVSINFTDLTSVTVPPLPGLDNNIGGCLVISYDFAAGDELPTTTDEGPLVISGTNHEPFGCAYSDLDGRYHCQSTTVANAGGSADQVAYTLTNAGQTITFTFEGSPFSAANALRGTYVIFTGLTETAGGAASPLNGVAMPVIGNDTTSLTVANTPAYVGAGGTGGATATYTALIGEAPIPGGFQFLDEGDTVTVSHPTASDFVGEFEKTSGVDGTGFDLDDASALPHEFPATAADLTYSCSGAGGTCGTADAGQLNVMTISGEATNAPLDGLSPFEMPDTADATKFVTFQCSAITGIDSIDLPMEAVQAVLDIEPTRVRVAIGAFAGQFITDTDATPDDSSQLIVGNLLIGFTDF